MKINKKIEELTPVADLEGDKWSKRTRKYSPTHFRGQAHKTLKEHSTLPTINEENGNTNESQQKPVKIVKGLKRKRKNKPLYFSPVKILKVEKVNECNSSSPVKILSIEEPVIVNECNSSSPVNILSVEKPIIVNECNSSSPVRILSIEEPVIVNECNSFSHVNIPSVEEPVIVNECNSSSPVKILSEEPVIVNECNSSSPVKILSVEKPIIANECNRFVISPNYEMWPNGLIKEPRYYFTKEKVTIGRYKLLGRDRTYNLQIDDYNQLRYGSWLGEEIVNLLISSSISIP